MPALKLNDVPARVAAWHNRHPLARRIDPSQVHSIGGLGLPFASDQPLATGDAAVTPAAAPPAPDELFDPSGHGAPPPAPPGDALLAAVPEVGDAGPSPAPGGADAADAAGADAGPGEAPPASAPDAAPEPAAPQAPAAEPATGNAAAAEAIDPDDAEPELVLGQDSDAGPDDGTATPPAADGPDATDAPPAAAAQATTPPDGTAADEPDPLDPTQPRDAAEARTSGAEPPPPPDPAAEPADAAGGPTPPADPAAPVLQTGAPATPHDGQAPAGPLAARLEAARTAARQTGPGAAPPPRARWWQRFWPLLRRQRTADSPAWPRPPVGHAGRLLPLFPRDLLAPLTPKQIAGWLRRHGAHTTLAPAGWPKRLERPDPLLQATTRGGPNRHPVTLHMLTAAIDHGPRRVRVLIDADGEVFGPRLLSPWRVLATTGAVALATGLVAWAGWQNAQARHAAPALAAASAAGDAASDAQAAADPTPADAGASAPATTAQADTAGHAASAPHPAEAGAGADADAASAQAGQTAQPRHGAASDPAALAVQAPLTAPESAARGHRALAPAQAASAVMVSPEVLLAGRWPPGGPGAPRSAAPPGSPLPASADAPHGTTPHDAAPTGPAPAGTATPGSTLPGAGTAAVAPLTITTVPPPRFPERRASGPLVRIRPMLSDEERQIARQQSEAARAAARGEPPPAPASAAAPSSRPDAPVAPNARYAVVTEGAKERETAEAQLAQMMSVRARLPPPGPAFTELLQLDGRWRAAQWPFATEAEAARAREMLTMRGLKAEVVNF